ncbi:hypothetical protein [Embleya sp. NPDC005575]|uniref:hypothetical protein n=1 Tax=Embleya sp. NPDC005575 TaxID=3156892 RepID=UPI0033BEC7F1
MAPTTVGPWDQWLSPALSGLVTGLGMWNWNALAGVERVGGYLAGTWDPPAGEDGPGIIGDGSWPPVIGRIGAIALRAAAPATRVEHREALLAFLENWAGTPMADPSARLRIGAARADAKAVRNEHGATIATTWPQDGRCAVVQVRTGDADPPEFGEPTDWVEVARGWGDAGQLRRLIALVRERGPMPWDPAAVRLLGAETGVSRAAAALLSTGDAGGVRTVPPLDPEQRAVLGLSTAEADAGYDELRRLTELERLELFAHVLPEDPAELWEPTGPGVLTARIAAAWRARFGRARQVPEETLSVLAEHRRLTLHTPAAHVCAAFMAPETHPLTARDHDPWLAEGLGGTYCTSEEQGVRWFQDFLLALAVALPIVYAELPAGDPVRAGLPATVAALRARLDHPGLLLNGGYTARYHESADELRALFGERPHVGPIPLTTASFDDGLSIATIAEPSEKYPHPFVRMYFRPARYGVDERSALLRQVASGNADVRDTVDMLRGDWCARVVERVAGDALPAGGYEGNPALSAPETVARVEKALGVEADAAALYLQLLAIERPSDRRIRLWNGWNATRHREAAAALVAAGVVVADKRARAGRGIFLPGDWAKARKPLWPIEVWKANLLGVRRIGDQVWAEQIWRLTLPELFAHAWDLVERGEGPG